MTGRWPGGLARRNGLWGFAPGPGFGLGGLAVAGVVLGGEVGVPAAQGAGDAGAGMGGEVVAVGLPGLAGEPAGGHARFEDGVLDAAAPPGDVVGDGGVDQGEKGGVVVEGHGAGFRAKGLP